MPGDTHVRILDAAERLFYSDGIAVTGVDAVAREAGVSVVTLYKHCGSKDGLVAAVLARRLESWLAVWREQVAAADDPRAQVLAVFDAVTEFRRRSGPTQWCTFLATASERASADDAPAELVVRDTELLRQELGRLARVAEPGRAEEVVEIVLLVYNGVLCSLLRGQPADAAAVGRRTAAAALGWGTG
jgi:AcrR family transcriptional regulator